MSKRRSYASVISSVIRSILAASRLGAPFHDLHEAAVQRDLQPPEQIVLRSERETWTSVVNSTMRGSGSTTTQDHRRQTTGRCRWRASSNPPVTNRRPAASRPFGSFSACATGGKRIVRAEKRNHVASDYQSSAPPESDNLLEALTAPLVTRFPRRRPPATSTSGTSSTRSTSGGSPARSMAGSCCASRIRDRVRCRPEYEGRSSGRPRMARIRARLRARALAAPEQDASGLRAGA